MAKVASARVELDGARDALRQHWPEYLIEAVGLGVFMVVAGLCVMLLEQPGSPLHQAIASPDLRRGLIGVTMGLTAVAIIYSPWGRQSGAHINPAVTLTFWRLGKVAPWDAFFYVLSQFAGGLAGVLIAAAAARQIIAHPSVDYVTTVPGPSGVSVAFVAELVMSLLLMTVVLTVS